MGNNNNHVANDSAQCVIRCRTKQDDAQQSYLPERFHFLRPAPDRAERPAERPDKPSSELRFMANCLMLMKAIITADNGTPARVAAAAPGYFESIFSWSSLSIWPLYLIKEKKSLAHLHTISSLFVRNSAIAQ